MTTIQGFIALDTAKNEKPCAGNRKNKQLYHMCNNNSPLKTFIPQSCPSLPTLTCPDTLLNLKKKKEKSTSPSTTADTSLHRTTRAAGFMLPLAKLSFIFIGKHSF